MNDFEDDILHSLDTLKTGGLILYPTDTIWGIGCDATNAAAVSKVFELKNRPGEKSMIVLVATEQDVLQYTGQPDTAVFDYLRSIVKPITVIYEGGVGLAPNLLNTDGSIAIRICHDTFCRQLIKRFGKPIVSTSANLSGEPSPAGFAGISPVIRNGVDYVVHHRREEQVESTPSRLIRWQNGEPIVLRP
jgi:L-threonylcarbamoyladenylate synthase